MPRLKTIFTATILSALVAAALLYGFLPSIAASAAGRRFVEAAASAATGYQVSLGALQTDRNLNIRAERIAVSGDGGPFFKAETIRIAAPWPSLADGRTEEVEIRGWLLEPGRLPPASAGGSKGEAERLPFRMLTLDDGRISLPGPAADDSGALDLLVTRARIEPVADQQRLKVDAHLDAPALDGTVEVKGHVDPTRQDFEVVFDITADDIGTALSRANASGGTTADSTPNADGEARVSLEGRALAAGNLASAVDCRITASIDGLPWWPRPLGVDGRVELIAAERRLSVDVALDPGEGLPALSVTGSADVGRSDGVVRTSAKWLDVPLPVLASLTWQDAPLEARNGTASLDLTIAGPAASPSVGGALLASGIRLDGRQRVRIGDARIAFGVSDGAVVVEPGAAKLSRVELSTEGFEAGIASLTAGGRFPLDQQRPVTIDTWRLDGLSFNNEDFTRAGDGIRIRGTRSDPGAKAPAGSLRLQGAVEKGEFLWDPFYFELQRTKPAFDLSLIPDGESFALRRFAVRAPGVVSVRADRRTSPGSDTIEAEVDVTDPDVLLGILGREPFGESSPAIASSTADGRLQAKIKHVRKNGELFALTGNVRIVDGVFDVERPVAAHIGGIDLDLPLRIGPGTRTGVTEPGWLRYGRSSIGGVNIPAFDLPLRILGDVIESDETVELDLLGGRVAISGLRINDLSRAGRTATFRMRADDLAVRDLAVAAGWPAMDGTVDGRFARIEASGSQIVTEGEALVDVFGGVVRVRNMAVKQLFTRVPSFFADIEANGIDLSKATGSLGYGMVSGVLNGRVDALEVAARQPVSFDARFETVPVRGVDQWMSVAALQQLSILGGSGGSSLTKSILGFFDRYRYAKMGMSCSLENDRFELRGIERTDGKDFLVVGALFPPTVNVVSHNQLVSFREMVKRLGRIAAVPEGGAKTE